MTVLRVTFYLIREGEPPRVCRCKAPAVWRCETLFSRESAYVTQPSTRGRRWRNVCQTCRERIEGGAR